MKKNLPRGFTRLPGIHAALACLLACGGLAATAGLAKAEAGGELTRDELGQAAVAGKAGAPNRMVKLPPFLVTGATVSEWQYAALPGMEILSCCQAAETEEFVREVCWQQASLDQLAPPGLQARSSVPISLILFSEDVRRAMSRSVADIARGEAAQVRSQIEGTGYQPMAVPDTELIPQLKLWDEDSSGVDIILKHRQSGGFGNISFTPDYLYFLLSRRVPPVPSWFVEGVMDLYQLQQMARTHSEASQRVPVRVETSRGDFELEMETGPDPSRWRIPALPPLAWITPNVAAVAAAHPEFLVLPLSQILAGSPPPTKSDADKKRWFTRVTFGHTRSGASADPDEPIDVGAADEIGWVPLAPMPELLKELPARTSPEAMKEWLERFWGPLKPMPELLDDYPPGSSPDSEKRAWLERFWTAVQAQMILRRGAEADSPWRREAWRAQISLFLRWVYDDRTQARRQALWRYFEAAGTGKAEEGVFRDCFGMGYDEASRQMLAYAPEALRRGIDLARGVSADVPDIRLREATPGERARILGDWQRKEIEFVRASAPEYADEYVEQAGHTLLDAYDQGSRDPGLEAALGIYESSIGDGELARGYLEAAVAAEVKRPRAYVELARLRFREALARPAAAGGRLDARQTASVLGLLDTIRSQLPPQRSGYELAAEVWSHSAETPGPSDLAALAEGVRYFPADSQLAAAAARLKMRVRPDNP